MKSTRRAQVKRRGAIAILYLYITGAAVLFYLSFIFPTQWLKVVRIRQNCGLGIRVFQISDLHVERLRISCERLRRLISEERPDYIVLTGDFTAKSRFLPKVRQYAEAVCAAGSGVPVLAVLGNHDYRLPPREREQLVQILESAGAKVLLNESVEIAGIQWIGIDDFTRKERCGSGVPTGGPAEAMRGFDP